MRLFVKKNECLKDKVYHKVRDHCHYTWEYRGAALNIVNLKYSVPKIYWYSYDYHFIIKKLAEEFLKKLFV